MWDIKKDSRILFLILLFIIIIFNRFLFSQSPPLIMPKSDLGSDFPREIWPTVNYISQVFSTTREIPLWRPYVLCGSPIAGHPIIPFFYPLYWLTLALPTSLSLNWIVILNLWWCAAGTYLYLRNYLSASRDTAFIGAILFGLSPKWIAHLSGGHWYIIAAIAWYPWAWLCVYKFWKTKKIIWGILFGLTCAAQALNHLQILYITLLSIAGAAIFQYQKPLKTWLKENMLFFGIAGFVGFGLSCPHLLPIFENISLSTRSSLTFQDAVSGSLHPALLIGLFFPPDLKYPEIFIFPGTVISLLVVRAVFLKNTPIIRRWFFAVLISTLIILGHYTPLYKILYNLAPGFAMLRNPTRWWILGLFSLTILAIISLQNWISLKQKQSNKLKFCIIVVCFTQIIFCLVKQQNPNLLPFNTLMPTITCVGITCCLLLKPKTKPRFCLLGLILISQIWMVNELISPTCLDNCSTYPAISQFLQNHSEEGERYLAPYTDLSMISLVTHDLRSAGGYDSFQYSALRDVLHQSTGCDFTQYAVSVPATQTHPTAREQCPEVIPNVKLLEMLNIRYLLLPSEHSAIEENNAKMVFNEDDLQVYDLGPGFGQEFSATKTQLTTSNHCAKQLSLADLPHTALIEDPQHHLFDAQPVQILAVERRINRISYEVFAPTRGLLIRSETWTLGWKVSIDQQEAKCVRINCALQGVLVPEGKHHIEFSYQPLGLKLGKIISFWTMFLIILYALRYLWKIENLFYPRK
jgi:hypothetical protein